jgi:hypothetical protein
VTQRRDAESRDAADGGEPKTFGEHLAHQPSAPRPERPPQAELALARRAARQQQVRDVDTRHEEDESHGADEGEQRWPELPDHLFLQ